MKISVVIPVYQSVNYIEECLNSVVAQTIPDDIECILVDDCGGDGSMEVAKRFIDAYQGSVEFQIVSHKTNRGAAAARNTGLEVATGDYIYYLDSDDWIIPSCFEKLLGLVYKYPSVNMVHAGIKTTDGSIPWFDFEMNHFPEYVDDFYEIKVNLLGSEKIPASPVNKLIPISFLRANSILFQEGIVIEDVLWCNQLAKHVKSIACLNKNTYIYRIHQGSVVTSGLGIDPFRKLIVYDLMIDGIDEPYVDEQVNHLLYLLDKVFFENNNAEIRRSVGKLYKKLSCYCTDNIKKRLRLKSFLAGLDKGNESIPYYLSYQLTSETSYGRILSLVLKKAMHI